MRMFNADGSESEMCGNGVRCVAKYAYDHGLSRSNPMKVETGRGVLTLQLDVRNGKVAQVTVNMGQPILEPDRIGFDPSAVMPAERAHSHYFQLGRIPFEGVPISVGNPHVVFWTTEVQALDLNILGPLAEHHAAFPKRVNAHWVQVISQNEVRMRTWERGSGITLACGTGATAVCVAGVLTGRTARKVLIHLPGGDLQLDWKESDNCVYKTGPATEVFSGQWLDPG
jgi:diaminopimelate epimerase